MKDDNQNKDEKNPVRWDEDKNENEKIEEEYLIAISIVCIPKLNRILCKVKTIREDNMNFLN